MLPHAVLGSTRKRTQTRCRITGEVAHLIDFPKSAAPVHIGSAFLLLWNLLNSSFETWVMQQKILQNDRKPTKVMERLGRAVE
ncbi:hypothetical protein RA28_06475 [Ruegeria sp. ANG-S4]|nr:hypothetical protein RA28_06475 [Ruegeria sp. ANG-S4]